VRLPAVSGTFYPGTAEELRQALRDCFESPRGPGGIPSSPPPSPGPVVAAVVPHAGYVYSGPVAAHVYARLARQRPYATVLILGVNHHGLGSLFSVCDRDWKTPLGTVPTDRELVRLLAEGPVEVDAEAQRFEHSIEVQVPFLQTIYAHHPWRIVGLQVTMAPLESLVDLGRWVRRCVQGRDVLLLASTDFSHYLPPSEVRRWDDLALEALRSLSPERLYRTVVDHDISMCGIAPTTVLLSALEGRSLRSQTLAVGTSADAEPMDRAVGYASVVIEESPRAGSGSNDRVRPGNQIEGTRGGPLS
jgi:AmmeMemoRadiSam system protein B